MPDIVITDFMNALGVVRVSTPYIAGAVTESNARIGATIADPVISSLEGKAG